MMSRSSSANFACVSSPFTFTSKKISLSDFLSVLWRSCLLRWSKICRRSYLTWSIWRFRPSFASLASAGARRCTFTVKLRTSSATSASTARSAVASTTCLSRKSESALANLFPSWSSTSCLHCSWSLWRQLSWFWMATSKCVMLKKTQRSLRMPRRIWRRSSKTIGFHLGTYLTSWRILLIPSKQSVGRIWPI